jgi:hypothetical protein
MVALPVRNTRGNAICNNRRSEKGKKKRGIFVGVERIKNKEKKLKSRNVRTVNTLSKEAKKPQSSCIYCMVALPL